MRKLTIVFVDDNYHALNFIKKSLNPRQTYWKMQFFDRSLDALQYVKFHHVDVFVADINMPGYEGTKLLTKAFELQPDCVRLVLVNEEEVALHNPADMFCHAFLTKPCDIDSLINIIERSTRIRYKLNSNKLIKDLNGLKALPAIPTLFLQITEALNSPASSMQSIGQLIERDPGVTAKILQLINSAYFGMPREIVSITEAITFLGIEVVRSLFLSINLFSAYENRVSTLFNLQSLWQHNLRVGHIASKLAAYARAGETIITQARTAGVLHDVGILILADMYPKEFSDALSLMTQKHISLDEAESEVFHATHSEVGAYLMCLWGLADEIVEAIAYQHHPLEAENERFSPLTAVHIANVMDISHGGYTLEGEHHLNQIYLENINFQVPALSELK